MFLRTKKVRGHTYVQIVENRREKGKVRQRVLAGLGRLDELQESGRLEGLLKSAARFSQSLLILSAHRSGELPALVNRRIGPPLIFERLWRETGCQEVIQSLARQRRFRFSLERAIFLTVLHRLLDPGSDRAAEKWKEAYRIEGAQELELHQLYRSMAWLGEELPEGEQAGRTPFVPRCGKDLIEEELFGWRRNLFTSLDLVFFDTTSLYFHGQGGETMGRWGKSKDHRPDLPQMVIGVVLDSRGLPICAEMWPGNTTDVKTLIPVVDRLEKRFSIRRICIVADRGMISRDVLAELESEERRWDYILGVRLRNLKEARRDVLARAGRYREVRPARQRAKDPAPLKVKEVGVEERRYLLCLNEEQARADALIREAILESLEKKLRQGDKSLVGNKGYRRYLKTAGKRFEIDREKVAEEARFDGKWVLRTSLLLAPEEVALKYKQLWMVEEIMRTIKSVLQTRPIYHKRDETIRGHVFCSFLALVLRKELEDRLEAAGYRWEWADVIHDLDLLEEIEVEQHQRRFLLRTEARGVVGAVFQAVGVALPPTV
ncbi:IS1634 family transposase, partial [Acidobacteria bacterium AH-259-G07]|nr:IS1634 family transposase [Acidobacteria bacterium AH-259-G07]